MDYRQEEYQQELERVQDRDFTHNWVSSSAFIFYLSTVCWLALIFGACYGLYSTRFEKSHPDKVTVQESSMYTPKYATPGSPELGK